MSSFAPTTGQGASPYHPNTYPPAFSQLPPLPPQNASETVPPGSPRKCSVRGCSNIVEATTDLITSKKMCVPCREKHRGYANTKRARRKAEKTLVSKMSLGSVNAQDVEQPLWSKAQNGAGSSAAPTQPPPSTLHTQSPNSTPWALDPALYAQTPVSSSSTLAGALTLQPSAIPRVRQSTLPPLPPRADVPTDGASESATTVSGIPQSLDGPRYCSVKGCKAIILDTIEAYPFKMCRECRTRYRHYGITKRAKWKAEREVFDKELETLRVKEDERRVSSGIPPLIDGTDEHRAWELSIISAQLSPPPDQEPEDGPSSSSAPALPAPPPPPTLPLRMCTVSHCHNLLPGHYRYKRCEAHRIQNRFHSKLKRGREKIEKGFMLPDGTMLVAPGPIKLKKNEEPKEDADTTSQDKDGSDQIEGPSDGNGTPEVPSTTDEVSDIPGKIIPRRSRSAFSCREDGCCNLILPGARWRSCEPCREISKTARQVKKAAEKAEKAALAPPPPPVVASSPATSSTVPPTTPQVIHAPSVTLPPSYTMPVPLLAVPPGFAMSAPPLSMQNNFSMTGTGTPASYPPGHTSTSTLLTVNEPPPAKTPSRAQPPSSEPRFIEYVVPESEDGAEPPVRPVRKYRRWPRYDKNGTLIANGESFSASVVAESVYTPAAQSQTVPEPSTIPAPRKYRKYSTLDKDGRPPSSASVVPLPTTLSTAPTTAPSLPAAGPSSSSTAPYPSPAPYPYYLPHPGYYGMPTQLPGSAPGQPPMMFIPFAYPPFTPSGDTSGAPPGPTPLPYYYPYPLTTLPPGAGYPYPPSAVVPAATSTAPAATTAGGYQSQYAAYRSQPQSQQHQFQVNPSVSAPLPPSTIANTSGEGYAYYKYRVDLKNPAPAAPEEQQSNKRRRLSEEGNSAHTVQQQQEAATTVSDVGTAAPPPEVPSSTASAPVSTSAAPTAEDEPNTSHPDAPSAQAQAQSTRCGNKTCNRTITPGAPGIMCDKCRSKMKRRVAATKQRFKLEKKKVAVSSAA